MNTAFRSSSQSVTDPETLKLRQERDEVDEKRDSEEERKTVAYASLKGHPGWELIKKDFQQTIDSYRSGRFATEAIAKGLTDAELGSMTRTGNAIADELEHKIQTVEGAVLALEQDGPRKRV